MNYKYVYLVLVFFVVATPIALAQNDPGHDSLYILRDGDNISGVFNFTGTIFVPTPIAIGSPATKGYVDAQVAGSGNGSVVEVDTGTGLTGGPITDSGTISFDTTWGDGRYLRIIGGTLDGILNMGNNVISNVATPVAGSDAATKAYVDAQVAGSGDMSSFTIAADSGSSEVEDGDTITIQGGTGITTAESSRTVTISVDDDYVPYTGATQNLDLNQRNVSNFHIIQGHNSDYGIANNGTATIIGYIGDLT